MIWYSIDKYYKNDTSYMTYTHFVDPLPHGNDIHYYIRYCGVAASVNDDKTHLPFSFARRNKPYFWAILFSISHPLSRVRA